MTCTAISTQILRFASIIWQQLYRSNGRIHLRAESLYQQTLKISKDVLGDQFSDTAASLNGLATLYHAMGDAPRVEPLYRQALTIRQNVLGDQHPITGASLNSLARLYQNIGDYTQAEPLCQQSLQICQDVLGDQHPKTADLPRHHGRSCIKTLGITPRAEPLYQQALEDYAGQARRPAHGYCGQASIPWQKLNVAIQQFDLALNIDDTSFYN